MNLPYTWKEWSELGQAAALAGGATFITLKAALGYFMINLTVEPTVHRSRGRHRKTDDLLLTLKMTKGDREAATVCRVKITTNQVIGDKMVCLVSSHLPQAMPPKKHFSRWRLQANLCRSSVLSAGRVTNSGAAFQTIPN
jgi:hypothetical protein